MSDNQDDSGSSGPDYRHRRGSFAPGSTPAMALFRRSSIAVAIARPAIDASASGDPAGNRRPSVSAALGLANFRRESTSTTADDSAVEDDYSPTVPLARRLSMQPTTPTTRAMMAGITGSSPTADQGFSSWSDQLRHRAQSSVGGARPLFGTSPPREPARTEPAPAPASSASDAAAPTRALTTAEARRESRKPDPYQERILRGDFYND